MPSQPLTRVNLSCRNGIFWTTHCRLARITEAARAFKRQRDGSYLPECNICILHRTLCFIASKLQDLKLTKGESGEFYLYLTGVEPMTIACEASDHQVDLDNRRNDGMTSWSVCGVCLAPLIDDGSGWRMPSFDEIKAHGMRLVQRIEGRLN